jgi:spermidine/putrescine transport system ATP-binding protein
MQDELRRIQRSQARTFVHVTHDQEEAMAIADLVVIMNRGRIEDMGPPDRVYERPRTRFSANFLGESTVLEGTVAEAADGRLAVDTPCGRLVVEGRRARGDSVAVALRPEAVRFGEAGAGEQALGRLQITGQVFQGSFLRVTGTGASGFTLLAKVAPHTVPASSDAAPIAVRDSGLILLED